VRRTLFVSAGLALTALTVPAPASAHGLVQRADLPIPEWLFGWGATIVLVASFVGLASLWPTVRLEQVGWRPLPGRLGAYLGSRTVEVVCGILGVALLALVLLAGWAGEQIGQANFAPTFVYVIVWVGFVPASLLFGDVFRLFNPWRAVGRAVGAVAGRQAHQSYPERLGRWPAALFLLVFTWTELVGRTGDSPSQVATWVALYSAVTWAGMAVYGVETWERRGEAFGIYFNLFARLSCFETRDRVVGTRSLLGGLPRLDRLPGTVAFVAVMIGTVTYDGLSQGLAWTDGLGNALGDMFESIGFEGVLAADLAGTVGLLLGPLLIGALYALGVAGAQTAGGDMSGQYLRRAFVHSLVPIALAYVMAHYLTLLLFQGQAIGYLASDPLGRGWNIFGTADSAIDYSVLSQTATWYLQVGFVVVGHVFGLVLAHDRALALYSDDRTAVRSQYWMLGVMVLFTSLALWLLSQANA
jgi:hypothetical protein